MRIIAITGHTGGLGLALFNYFKDRGDEVIGMSRSNGYELPDRNSAVFDIARTADLFVNNAYGGQAQTEFIKLLYNKVPIISMGSMAADYPKDTAYYRNKKLLEETHVKFKKISPLPMLLLKMGYLENWTDREGVPYQQIVNAVDFWLNNPRASIIEFDNIRYDNSFRTD